MFMCNVGKSVEITVYTWYVTVDIFDLLIL